MKKRRKRSGNDIINPGTDILDSDIDTTDSGTETTDDSEGGTGIPDRLPPGHGDASYLVDETKSMERQRRLMEQEGHRKRARVNAREHGNEEQSQQDLDADVENSPLQHPYLDKQTYDGYDPSVNPEPPLNTEARREFDNQRREQEMEKQLRLGNMPKFTTAPKPRGP
ncbi:hypothetical protein E3983_05590 [Legionella israelensis]|uniref:Smr domain protein n=1 Tax=Legionella israelensis TaxID=454 RepID=A0AAX1EFU0_9GAMM|nr:hypothetical protein [Legionella israelensis]QBR83865.1 hypothetical protein E3983_05590 [Legionella israelensis]